VALPAAMLCVVELSTLKVRITGSASSRCRTISWMAEVLLLVVPFGIFFAVPEAQCQNAIGQATLSN